VRAFITFDLHEAGAHWHTQRDVTDPNSEADEGIDSVGTNGSPDDDDDVNESTILAKIDNDIYDGCDPNGAELNKIGLHLLKARLACQAGDGAEAYRSINRAIRSFDTFHSSLKMQLR
jgi:hypothetical protein